VGDIDEEPCPGCSGQCPACGRDIQAGTFDEGLAEVTRERDDARAACVEASQEIGRLQGVVIRHETAEAAALRRAEEAERRADAEFRKGCEWHEANRTARASLEEAVGLLATAPVKHEDRSPWVLCVRAFLRRYPATGGTPPEQSGG
jgi:hypothetical protein